MCGLDEKNLVLRFSRENFDFAVLAGNFGVKQNFTVLGESHFAVLSRKLDFAVLAVNSICGFDGKIRLCDFDGNN